MQVVDQVDLDNSELSASLVSLLPPPSLCQTQKYWGTKSFQEARRSHPVLIRFSLIAFYFQASELSPAIPPWRDSASSGQLSPTQIFPSFCR